MANNKFCQVSVAVEWPNQFDESKMSIDLFNLVWLLSYVSRNFDSCEIIVVGGGCGEVLDIMKRFSIEVNSVVNLDQFGISLHQEFAEGVWGLGKNSYLLLEYLKTKRIGLVFGFDTGGLLFYPLMLKSQGLELKNMYFVVVALNQTARSFLALEYLSATTMTLGKCFMERSVVENADYLITSPNCLNWFDRCNYEIVEAKTVTGLKLQIETDFIDHVSNDEIKFVVPIDCIPNPILKVVFLGIKLFSDRSESPVKVLFFGTSQRIINTRSRFSELIESSSIESSWLKVVCLDDLLKPFIFSASKFVLYDGDFFQSGLKLWLDCNEIGYIDLTKLSCGVGSPQNISPEKIYSFLSSFDSLWNAKEVVDEKILTEEIVVNSAISIDNDQFADKPLALVSVCIVHHERPDFLRRALTSVLHQTYKNIEVIVVDDGSKTQSTISSLMRLKEEFNKSNISFVRQSNRWLGAARNYAVSLAKGEYIIFMDDDNIAKTDLISTYVRALEATNSDIMTCFSGVFYEKGFNQYDESGPRVIRDFLPIGGCSSLGIFYNIFGDAACIVRKPVFDELGGFWEHYGLPKEDHDFFLRAVSSGYKLGVVPQRLFFYRAADDGMMRLSLNNASYDYSVLHMMINFGNETARLSVVEKSLLGLMLVRYHRRPSKKVSSKIKVFRFVWKLMGYVRMQKIARTLLK